MESVLRPTKAEIKFLNLAYNRFYDIKEEVFEDEFLDKDSYYRFSRIKEIFAIYAEILNYEPIKMVIDELKKERPSMEAEIGSELFKFIRNVFSHFSFFDCWDDVYINKLIVNWNREGLSIDRFLQKYTGKGEVKYRFWESDKKTMTYLNISFPDNYNEESKIYLKDILSEKEGVKFSLILMKQIMDTQIIVD